MSRFYTLCVLLVLCAVPSILNAEDESGTYVPERLDQPYLPGQGQLRGGQRAVSMAPPGSVQVNVDSNGMNIIGDAANEPSLAIDPTNPNLIAVGWRQFDTIASNFRQAGNAYSTDGGATWTFPGVLTPGVFRSDPVLAADNDGRFFYNSLQTTFCIDVFQSANAGVTWPTSVPAFGGDKAWMDIDRTAGTGTGFLHMAWQNAARCSNVPNGRLFTRSTDHGATWLTPITITNNPRFGVTAVGPDGAVYVTGTTASSSTFVVAKSTNAQNGGVTPTWAFSVTGNFLGGSQLLSAGPNPAGLLGQVWIAANPLNASHVYLLCSVDPTGSDPLDVKFSRSVDGGQTWSAPVRVNDDPGTTAYQWFGTLSVAPNGRIDVVWNDTRDDPLNQLSKTRYTYSTDEGVTWAPSYAFTPAWDSTVGFPNQNKIGDYYHMISDNVAAHLIYAATFNGEQDVYYTTLEPNDCNRNGIADNLDISNMTSNDCNSNGLPDECENDCNLDQIADACQLAGNDCNSNGVPDDCEPGHEDCNNNSVFDQCEGFVDCNGNGHWDLCDIANSTSPDCNGNNMPDECELPIGASATDACGNAPFISTGIAYAGSNATATTDAGSGASCGSSGRDVYFKYRPVISGSLNLSLCLGSTFDTIMTVHSGCPATTVNQLAGACDDDGCAPGGPSVINGIVVTAGTTYLIRVAGFDNGTGGDTGHYSLTLAGPTGVGDCDGNSVPDTCEMAAGGDANGNGIPDICEPFPACGTCPGDMNGDNSVDGRDIPAFIACYLVFPTVPGNCGCADMNVNHQINSVDVDELVNKLLLGGCP
jgi:hypothetical protein